MSRQYKTRDDIRRGYIPFLIAHQPQPQRRRAAAVHGRLAVARGVEAAGVRHRDVRVPRRLVRRRKLERPPRDHLDRRRCPGRQPPFWAVERPARPCKSAVQKQSTVGDAEGA